jgi:hypothetical protein
VLWTGIQIQGSQKKASETTEKTEDTYFEHLDVLSGRVEAFPEDWKSFMEVQTSNNFLALTLYLCINYR